MALHLCQQVEPKKVVFLATPNIVFYTNMVANDVLRRFAASKEISSTASGKSTVHVSMYPPGGCQVGDLDHQHSVNPSLRERTRSASIEVGKEEVGSVPPNQERLGGKG